MCIRDRTYIGKGAKSTTSNDGVSGSLLGDLVGFNNPSYIFVDSDKVLVGSQSGYLDEIDKSKFTLSERDTAWLQQMGGPRIKRWDGVKAAIDAVVNDSTLTTGAYFGFGHWNSGEVSTKKKVLEGAGIVITSLTVNTILTGLLVKHIHKELRKDVIVIRV